MVTFNYVKTPGCLPVIKVSYLPLWKVTDTTFNPLSPHDALKHHFTSLKTNLIFLQLWAL